MYTDDVFYESLSSPSKSGSKPIGVIIRRSLSSDSSDHRNIELDLDLDHEQHPLKRIAMSNPYVISRSHESHEACRLCFAILFLVLAAFSNLAALAYIHDFVGREALPDVVFAVIPEQTWALKVGDSMVMLCVIFLITLVVCHRERVVILRRTFFIVACLYSMRTVSLLCTQLPSGYVDNDSQCRAKLNQSIISWDLFALRILEQAYKFGFQDVNAKMLCGDLLFSGHTISMVTSALTISYYLPDSIRPLRYIPWILACIGMICMIISRTHYTIDVIFAYWLSNGVFTLYHAFAEIETTRERESSMMRHLFLIRVVAWLEQNTTPNRLENRIQIPLIARFYKWWGDPSRSNFCPCFLSSVHVNNNNCSITVACKNKNNCTNINNSINSYNTKQISCFNNLSV